MKILSYIAILGIGAFAGNMINIGLSYAIHWQSLDPIDFMKVFKVDFPMLLAPTSATLLPALITSLVLTIRSKNEKKRYWRNTLFGLVITCAITAVYHLPTNLDFMELSYSPEVASSKLGIWVALHWVRVILTLGSGVFALTAISKG